MTFVLSIIFLTSTLAAFQVFTIGTYGVAPAIIMLAFFYAYILKRIIWNGDKLHYQPSISLILLIIIISIVLISGITPLIGVNKYEISQFFKTSFHFLFLTTFTLICAFYRIENFRWRTVIRVFLVFSIFINIYGIYQVVARAFDLPFAWIELSNESLTARGTAVGFDPYKQLALQFENFYRATSIFSEPSFYASYNIIVMIFLIIPLLKTKTGFIKSNALKIFILIFTVAALFLTFSLTGLLSFLLLTFTVFLIERSKRLKYFIYFLAGTVFVILITDSLVKNVTEISVANLFIDRIERISKSSKIGNESMNGESVNVRVDYQQQAYNIWQQYPILGCGIGLVGYNKKVDLKFADTALTQVLAETGAIGTFFYLAFFAVTFFLVLKLNIFCNKSYILNDVDKCLAACCLYLFVHLTVINFITANNLITPISWLYIGFIFSIMNNTYSKLGYKFSIIEVFPKGIKNKLIGAISQ
ncbi:MAG TPA: O-antigen ligase family protein [Candidatus Kapabacteria bacterium]|nr:O-antigen ligase family protein [Candidatus Kapabacteria bacterium]